MGHAHPAPSILIDYFTAGEGRPLVLAHGITESRRSWDPLLAPLIGAGYRVTAIDLRGHGASSVVAPYDLTTMAGDLASMLTEIEATTRSWSGTRSAVPSCRRTQLVARAVG